MFVSQGFVLAQRSTWRAAAMRTHQPLCPSAVSDMACVPPLASGLTIAIELQEQKSKSKQVRRLCFVED